MCYPIYNAGHTVAEIVYDFEKFSKAILDYVKQYEPDAAEARLSIAGQGPILEKIQPKNLVWPGAPGGRISDNSVQQFIEFPILHEDDMDYFMADYTGWLLRKGYPAVAGVLEPLANWDFRKHLPTNMLNGLIHMLSTPETREMMQTLWELSDAIKVVDQKNKALNQNLIDLGFPVTSSAIALTPFDGYSDFFRGTLDTMMDLYEHPEVIDHFIDRHIDVVLDSISNQAKLAPGKWCFVPLHKGMDSFLTDQQYRDYYWKHLKRMIHHIVDVGMVPFIFTEGPYNLRIKYLSEVPKGKVVYSFEEVDPVEVKKQLGDIACIQGIFPVYLLHYGTKQQVIDETKRLIDILAPGGGYIFNTGAGFDQAKPENVEAMFDTVKTYGKR